MPGWSEFLLTYGKDWPDRRLASPDDRGRKTVVHHNRLGRSFAFRLPACRGMAAFARCDGDTGCPCCVSRPPPQNGLMASLALCVTSLVVAYLVLRYRVHVVVVVQPRSGRAQPRTVSGSKTAGKQRDLCQNKHAPEITAALVGLGARKEKARAIATRVCASGTHDFDALLRAAIQEVAA
jgi:hypothetical protein